MLVQIPLKISLRNEASFDTFVTEQENLAILLNKLQQTSNLSFSGCYYLYGLEGVGKTHLLQAACRFYTENKRQSVYFPMSDTSLPLIPDVFQGLEKIDLVCLDDAEYLFEDKSWQTSLAKLLAKSRVLGNRVVISGNRPLNELVVTCSKLQQELMLIQSLEVRDLVSNKDKVLALQKHASYKGFNLPVEVANYLLRQVSKEVSDLLKVLELLEQESLAEKRRLTLPFVKKILES